MCSLYLRRECTPLRIEELSEGAGKTQSVLVVLCQCTAFWLTFNIDVDTHMRFWQARGQAFPFVPRGARSNVGHLCPRAILWTNLTCRPAAHREKIASVARKRRDPSVETRLSRVVKSQNPDRIDAIYNGRPYELAPPEYIEDCCPAFATYVSIMEGEQPEFSTEELYTARDLVLAGMRPSDDPVKALAAAMTLEVHRQVFAKHTLRTQHASAAFTPDGVSFAGKPARDGSQPVMGITEVATKANSRRHVFEMQGQLDYLAFYCSEEVRGRI